MKDMFDINLLSHVTALDRQSSVSNEQINLKKRDIERNKNKNSSHQGKKFVPIPNPRKARNTQDEDPENHGTIDITI